MKDRFEGNLEILSLFLSDDDDDGGDDDDGYGGGGVFSSKVLRELIDGELEVERYFDVISERLGLLGIDKLVYLDFYILEGGFEYYFVGKGGDGVVYLNDDGEWVKFNVRGYLYRIDERGFRRILIILRFLKYIFDEWRKMLSIVRKGIVKVEEKKFEVEKEKKKSDAKIKESEERVKRKEEKKKEKEVKKVKFFKKDDKDDYVLGVVMF